MITPAIFEDMMQEYADNLNKRNVNEISIQNKALDDVIAVLKQHGYDAGADIFADHIVYGERKNNAND